MKQFIAALVAGLLFAGAAQAEPANKKCPVSGKDVKADQTSDVSVTVGFCCEKCQAKFEGDAKMKAEAVKKYAGSKQKAAIFFGNRINQFVDATPELCGGAQYQPFPELQALQRLN